MHYLEDAVELLEYLPEELKKRCKELQQLDLKSSDGLNKLLKDSRTFFENFTTSSSVESEQKNRELLDRFQALNDLEEGKVQLAEYVQLVLEKYQEKIAKDLVEFKTELEVDNPGETDLIEKNFMQSLSSGRQHDGLDGFHKLNDALEQQLDPLKTTVSEYEHGPSFRQNGHGSGDTDLTLQLQQRTQQFDEFRIPANLRRPTQQDTRSPSDSRSSIFDDDIFDSEIVPPPVKKLKPAPSTRFLPQSQPNDLPGSKPDPLSTASLIPSTSTKSEDDHFERNDFGTTPPSSHSRLIRMPLLAGSQASRHGRPRKLTKKVEQMLSVGTHRETGRTPSRANSVTDAVRGAKRRQKKGATEEDGQEELEEEAIDDEDSYGYQDEEEDEEEGEEDGDDNKTWCICKQRSHGKMVACDNKNCRFEWFHYECVGITQEPKGEWYCPTCTMARWDGTRS